MDKAKYALSQAIQRGRLVPADKFCMWGGTRRITGHHPDYTRPLHVIWVCATCHHRIHTLERERAKGLHLPSTLSTFESS